MDDLYISVELDEYLQLRELRDFLTILKEYGLEDWEGFESALNEFLDEDETRDDPTLYY